ncbi:MAG: YgiQ family radical SAM protein [Deltaproteobacteria bacterium]|jgi:uncharacterized radical SAM protein YgiQ|nr:YgiQ family radical SAM protein [Deltaproteobacteria bacterium]
MKKLTQPAFLPMSVKELEALGWKQPDVLLVSGDAYIDHPAFGIALLGRYLVEHGFTVAVLAQPAWEGTQAEQAFTSLPRPRLFAGVSAGAIDSMLAHHTAFRKKRSDDAYTPGGKSGARPNRATIMYSSLLRRFFPGLPIVLGGLEASLRRISHYDFWTDSLRRSILLDSKADLILCGMAEESLLQAANIADNLADNLTQTDDGQTKLPRKAFAAACRSVPGAVTALNSNEFAELDFLTTNNLLTLPSHEELLKNPFELLKATVTLEKEVHKAQVFLRQDSGDRILLLAPFADFQQTNQQTNQQSGQKNILDKIYALPFSRLPHPAYTAPIPAWEMIRTSITTHRGCAGGCSFCSLSLHQGRRISSRSKDSILNEARHIAAGSPLYAAQAKLKATPNKAKAPKWAGSISDVGGPTANMWQAFCALEAAQCSRASCLFPRLCPNFKCDQHKPVQLLRELARQPGVRHVRVASGVRYDLALQNQEAIKAYTMEFTGGQLKVAPEHICAEVLKYMRKPNPELFDKFLEAFAEFSRQAHKEQYIIPYLISAFPGCTEEHMQLLKSWLQKRHWSPKQVQCFIPTPGTVATAMFYCGRDEEGNTLHVAKTDAERLRQHHILLD